MVNIAFSRIIKVGTRQWEFNFRKLPHEPYHFHGDVATLQGDRIQFSLYKDQQSTWHIQGKQLPDWFQGAEEKLGTVVEQGLQSFQPAEIFISQG